MWNRLKKAVAVLIIIILLPYIVTIFINGGSMKTDEKSDGFELLLKDYCIRVLAAEVSSDYVEEMLKTQAVLVRTTVYKEVEELGKAILEKEDFYSDAKIDARWYQTLEEAWDETEGEVVMYGETLALVPFHQLSNGKTRSGKEVLGSEDYPYLQIKECPVDVEAEKQMESRFIAVENVKVDAYDSVGYALTVSVGAESCSGENFRDTYGLASSCFEVQDFEGRTRVITKGVGHGLGLSQYTANEMAKEGKTYQEILQFFFEGTQIREVAEILWSEK